MRSYADEEWVVNVDVSVGVGGKWTRGVRRRGHAANGNGSTGGSWVGSSRRGLRIGRGDMYGGYTRSNTLCGWEREMRGGEPQAAQGSREGGRDEIGTQDRLAPIYRQTD